MNMVILSGRLVRDPEIRYGSGAEPMCIAKFSLAVDKNYKKSADDKAYCIRQDRRSCREALHKGN